MPFITTENGVAIHYEDHGAGRPLVFIHGWGMSGRVWKFQVDAFKSGYRIITLDLRGHGESVLPEDAGLSMPDIAGDIGQLFADLNLADATLIGWSLGAQVALEAFRLAGSRLSALVLTGGTPRFSAGEGYEFGLPPVEVRGMALRIKRDRSKTMGDFFRRMFVEGEMTKEQNQRVVKEIVIPSRQPESAILLRALETLAESDQREILTAIGIPVLLIHGAADTTCLPDASRFMAARIRNAELCIIDGCGHAPFMSKPDEFNRLLGGFLARVYAGH
ncbi:AB hydrolase superfamily protein YisY [Geobacter sp. OR-1]|uniref:alpha/beta fold hydrolase n=1 Tax=Geobacter sp. OR-1 TaxID=1266765 RepID=UPI000543CD97|nr:alpha/beta fold hydrolase [Geobacter sp. OR-1]GAM08062.1 AB hydrolase superfamily protein YisY [Geobacter sp. OR-1]